MSKEPNWASSVQEPLYADEVNMKMSEFLALSDDEKVKAMPDEIPIGQVTEDKGICSICGGEAEADDFCFGCHQLVCLNCVDTPKHKCV